jgi:hypothetical protein
MKPTLLDLFCGAGGAGAGYAKAGFKVTGVDSIGGAGGSASLAFLIMHTPPITKPFYTSPPHIYKPVAIERGSASWCIVLIPLIVRGVMGGYKVFIQCQRNSK